jgi:3-hydroxy-9,10-secoandrosta-1,3,5(10)-triene-9,17-dione monooxygenase reductase component
METTGMFMEESAVTEATFRRVMSHFCTGVVVVAATEDEDPVGLTCQAFSALSLHPPLVVLGIGTRSTSWPKIERQGRFCVSMLSAHQRAIAERFAVSGALKFEGLDWHRSPGGSPLIPGCIAWVDCATESVTPAGDHLVVVARVVGLGTEDAVSKPPLLFYRGGFAELIHRGKLPAR